MLPAPHRDSDWPVSTLTAPLSAWVDCVAGVLRECEVTTLGDKSVLKKALEELLALDEEGLPEIEEEVEDEAPRKWYDPLNIL